MVSVDETKIAKLEAEVAALELERDHLVMAIVREGLKIGSYGSGLCITDESLDCLKARWQAEALESVRKAATNGDGCVSLDILLIDRINRLHRQAKGGE